ncbi:hypothetical protein GOODEAATRI_031741, partial [Goodea atripinnis]
NLLVVVFYLGHLLHTQKVTQVFGVQLEDLVRKQLRTIDMSDHGGVLEQQGCEQACFAGVRDSRVSWSRNHAKSVLLQVYFECHVLVCHSKQRESKSGSTIQTQIVKLLISKTKLRVDGEVCAPCLQLWDVHSPNLMDRRQSHTSELNLTSREHVVELEGYPAILRLSMLADFSWDQPEDLVMNLRV